MERFRYSNLSVINKFGCMDHLNVKGENMRTGTFLCWLFGHKFALRCRDDASSPGYHSYCTVFSEKCLRCGIVKESK